jgi:pyruvate dehydrogenase E1 component beta subunit
MVGVAIEAAATAAEEGISVEVLDLRTLVPLDAEALAASVARTGRAVVLEEAPQTAGCGAEVVATIQEEAFLSLEAPIRRVSGYDTPIPMPQMEDDYLPDARRALAAIRETVRY